MTFHSIYWAPAEVHVRARAGGRNSIDLEMETPFHRTDTLHLDGGGFCSM